MTSNVKNNYLHSLKMSGFETEEQTDNLLDAYTKVDEDKRASFLEEINKELEAFLTRESDNNDATDGVFDFLRDLSDSVQEEFEELLAGDSDKKQFIRALSRIFTLLLNTEGDTVEKIKRIIKIAIEPTLKIWQKPRPP